MDKTKILIVDDEMIMRESLAGWLQRDGHEVASAASGEDAIKILQNSRFDILLVDIKMEGMSGLEVLKLVKESAQLTKRVARIEKRMEGQPEVTLCQMRAQLYLNKKLLQIRSMMSYYTNFSILEIRNLKNWAMKL